VTWGTRRREKKEDEVIKSIMTEARALSRGSKYNGWPIRGGIVHKGGRERCSQSGRERETREISIRNKGIWSNCNRHVEGAKGSRCLQKRGSDSGGGTKDFQKGEIPKFSKGHDGQRRTRSVE